MKISLAYEIPEGFDISSVHKQVRNGKTWWIIWTCKLAPEVDQDHRKHFGRGESEEINEALDRAIRASISHEEAYNKIKNLPTPTHDPMSDLKLEDLF